MAVYPRPLLKTPLRTRTGAVSIRDIDGGAQGIFKLSVMSTLTWPSSIFGSPR
jgi:hypothetical protein